MDEQSQSVDELRREILRLQRQVSDIEQAIRSMEYEKMYSQMPRVGDPIANGSALGGKAMTIAEMNYKNIAQILREENDA